VLFTAGNDAWAYDAKADARVVAAMKGGRMLTAKAVSARGTLTEYDFPLAGFTKAYVAASNACGV
jgi:invasion protein IalB